MGVRAEWEGGGDVGGVGNADVGNADVGNAAPAVTTAGPERGAKLSAGWGELRAASGASGLLRCVGDVLVSL